MITYDFRCVVSFAETVLSCEETNTEIYSDLKLKDYEREIDFSFAVVVAAAM